MATYINRKPICFFRLRIYFPICCTSSSVSISEPVRLQGGEAAWSVPCKPITCPLSRAYLGKMTWQGDGLSPRMSCCNTPLSFPLVQVLISIISHCNRCVERYYSYILLFGANELLEGTGKPI